MLANARYIPDAANAIYDVLKEAAQLHTSKKRKYEGEDAEILSKVSTRALTTETLKEKLARHVEQVKLSSISISGPWKTRVLVLLQHCFLILLQCSIIRQLIRLLNS